MDDIGTLDSEAITKFKRTLDGYLSYLQAFKDKGSIERLLALRKFKKTITKISTDIDDLFKMVGLSSAQYQMEFRTQWENDIRKQQETLKGIMTSASELQRELRGNHDIRDALILLYAAQAKIEGGDPTVPDDLKRLVQQAFTDVKGLNNGHVEENPPWVLQEADIDFEEIPFAQGTFATVHHGIMDQHTRIVVKLVRSTEGGIDAAGQKQFLEQVNIWWNLKPHPHVARLLGACHFSRGPFLVCADAANGNMKYYLRKAPTNRYQMWSLLYQAAQGIAYLHSQNIIHGDVRLSNILITRDCQAQVADFGMSRTKRNSKTKTMTTRTDGGPMVSTWRWMAPECFTKRPQFISDIYGLGMCLLEAYTSQEPYHEITDDKDVKTKILARELPVRPVGMSDHVWNLIKRMTSDNRMEIKDVVDALKTLAAIEPPPPVFTTVWTNGTPAPTKTPSLGSAEVQILLDELKNGVTAMRAAKK